MVDWRGKRIFISGGAGVIGTALVNQLLEHGAHLLVGDLKPVPEQWISALWYREGDLNTITQKELISFDPEIFFHLAAAFERTSEDNPTFFEENFHHNVRLSHHLLHCLLRCTALKRIVFASSYLIYDPALYLSCEPWNRPVSINEEASIFPRNLCGAAKLLHERELLFARDILMSEFTAISARIFRSYGRGSRDLISRWIRTALKGEVITVFGKESWFDYIFADDVAEGLLYLAASSAEGMVNLGSGRSRRVEELIHLLQNFFPQLAVDEQISTLPFESSQADMRRFEQITGGFLPKQTLEETLPKIIDYEYSRL